MRLLLRLIVVLLPLAGFVWVVLELQRMLDEGQGLATISWLLGALAVLAVVEGLLFRFWLLPAFGAHLGERIYQGGYWPEDDPLLVLVERIRRDKDDKLLPKLEKAVLADARRARAWQEYAHVLQEVFAHHADALQVLCRGAEKVRPAEDRAMLLCRAAHIAAEELRDDRRAQELYREAAERYPRSSYGRLAATRLH